ncbi:hypothetical protein, partial [Mesorhizobium sp.]|uniref:hypothetical protein n=1 Tax=Mesorhizobium sp. TaxID=1871066 RepID=UPI0025D9F24F
SSPPPRHQILIQIVARFSSRSSRYKGRRFWRLGRGLEQGKGMGWIVREPVRSRLRISDDGEHGFHAMMSNDFG